MELMTNNPKKYHGLKGYGLEIVKRVSLEIPPTKENFRYLQTKKEQMGHLLKNGDLADPGRGPRRASYQDPRARRRRMSPY